ncbi:hypothetical protein Pcinc_024382 [Petrolisthes cinctipes]|uniref:CCHC-type domain-containing protein n=1 Tax=Petrolisthes cinctipes TaxID=88211 RepID=A0AAE1FA24_PETCI|nr:hypothetical protein Pcinc_024382 [Petrolisthes cinctipes]
MDLSVENLKAQAVALNLEGEDIVKFIFSQQEIVREEKARDRELQMAQLDLERERERFAAEKHRLQLELEAEKHRLQLEHDLQMAQLTKTSTNTQWSSAGSLDVSNSSLPVYKEGEDIDLYLLRFERAASLLKVDKDNYAMTLGILLRGKYADVYNNLPADVTKNYQLLRKALLKGFRVTSDMHRHNFRALKISAGENYEDFSALLGCLFDQWIDSYGIDHSFDSLRSYMILDQFLASLTPDVRVYIKEHNARTLEDAVALADKWSSSAHQNSHTRSSQSPLRVKISGAIPKTTDQPQTSRSNSPQSRPSSFVKQDHSKLICHGCGKRGHIRPHCPQRGRDNSPVCEDNLNKKE